MVKEGDYRGGLGWNMGGNWADWTETDTTEMEEGQPDVFLSGFPAASEEALT